MLGPRRQSAKPRPASPEAARRRGPRSRVLIASLCLLAVLIASQHHAIQAPRMIASATTEELTTEAGFQFARLRYRSEGGQQEAYYAYDGRWWERWETDHPVADENFVLRLQELSTVEVDQSPAVVDILTESLFDAPFLYLCDVGWLTLNDTEARQLGSYLSRGGFIWADDFWGFAEWSNFERAMAKIIPDSTWHTLGAEHPLLSMLFPLDDLPQIPARDFAHRSSHDPPWIHRQPAYDIEQAQLRAFTDSVGRIVAIASYNSDIGDGWEREAYGDWFFERFSSVAYAFGVNTVLYALSH